MPVLAAIRERFEREQPLAGYRISACLHVTTETANLMRTLKAGGADVVLCASNPLSTQDDVAAALVASTTCPSSRSRARTTTPTTRTSRRRSTTGRTSRWTTAPTWSASSTAHGASSSATSSAAPRRRRPASSGSRRSSATGCSASRSSPSTRRTRSTCSTTATARASRRSTASSARRTCCSPASGSSSPATAGAAAASRSRARGMGAHVIVTEVDPLQALEAVMDGFEVMPMGGRPRSATSSSPRPATSTSSPREHMEAMKDGAILANTGHFNVEIDIPALRAMAVETREARQFVEEYTLEDGRRLYLLADGRLVNLAAAEGHPARVMDMSFANQALAAEYAVAERGRARAQGLRVPEEIDSRDRAPQARDDGRRDRHAHRGAGEVPRLVGRGHVSTSATPRSTPAGRPGCSAISSRPGSSSRRARPPATGSTACAS